MYASCNARLLPAVSYENLACKPTTAQFISTLPVYNSKISNTGTNSEPAKCQPQKVSVPTNCQSCQCAAQNLQAFAKSHTCEQVSDHIDSISPWKSLNGQTPDQTRFMRFHALSDLASRHTGAYDQDATNKIYGDFPPDWPKMKQAMIGCTAAIETNASFEPLTIDQRTCTKKKKKVLASSSVGMSQQMITGYNEAVGVGHRINKVFTPFVSKIKRYQSENGQKILKEFDTLSTDPELQIEFLDYFLSVKASSLRYLNGGKIKSTNFEMVRQLAELYNASNTKVSYGKGVAACTECIYNLTQKTDYNSAQLDRCLAKAKTALCKEVQIDHPADNFKCGS